MKKPNEKHVHFAYTTIRHEVGALFCNNISSFGQFLQKHFTAMQHQLFALFRCFVIECGQRNES